ncbi:MAG: hypothetical protein ACI9NT_001734, partial [Bacteroidia bacterium]
MFMNLLYSILIYHGGIVSLGINRGTPLPHTLEAA